MRALPAAAILAASLSLAAPPAGAGPAGPAELAEAVLGAARRGEDERALELLGQLEREHAEAYASGHWDYLSGTLLQRLGAESVAVARFRRIAQSRGPLAGRARVRSASLLERSRPAVALALLRGAGRGAERGALEREGQILEVVLTWRAGERGRVETLLGGLRGERRREALRRLFEAAAGSAAISDARRFALRLLAGRDSDAAAGAAARWLLVSDSGRSARERLALGGALAVQRRFGAALGELAAAATDLHPGRERDAAVYLLGRTAMKAGDLDLAARSFWELVQRRSPLGLKARYQLGRIDVLCADLDSALAHFESVSALAAPGSELRADALLKLVRLHAQRGERPGALSWSQRCTEEFAATSRSAASCAIAAAGLALGSGEPENAVQALERSAPRDPAAAREVAYWRGIALARLGRGEEALAAWLRAARGEDLIASLSRARLAELPVPPRPERGPYLAAARAALEQGDAVAARRSAEAALDLGAAGGEEREALALLREAYRRLPAYRGAFEIEADVERIVRDVPTAAALLALGLDGEAAEELRSAGTRGEVERLAAVALLAERGGDFRASLRAAEQLAARLPADFRRAALPPGLLALLYPDPHAEAVELAGRQRRIDPDLIRAVMREESRFDAAALSAAGARGLMQFIPETARRIARSIGLGRIEEEAIHDPLVAIPLGAAYLAELMALFGGREGPAVAAYNAGEEAAFLWLRRSGSGELDGFLREIEYDETRQYVDRVLSTLAAYRGLRGSSG